MGNKIVKLLEDKFFSAKYKEGHLESLADHNDSIEKLIKRMHGPHHES
jgi:hypothetical protein